MRKTLLVTSQFPPSFGGVETYLFNLAKRLDPSRFLVLADKETGDAAFDKKQRYRTIRSEFLYPSRWIWPQWLPLLKKTKQLVKQEKIEHILAGQVLPVGTAAMITAQTFDIGYSVFTYALDIELPQRNPRHLRTMKKVLDNATKIFTISDDTKARIIRLGLPEKKIIKITPGLDLADFLPPSETILNISRRLQSQYDLRGKKIILTIGRLVARKGQDTVIKALPAILKDEPLAHYVIAGDGPYKNQLKELVRQLKVSPYVTFTGKFAEAEKAAWYNLGDVFAMVSRVENQLDIEGFGIVYLEANALKKPVVAGKSGGVADAVVDQKTGLLVQNPSDIDETADVILKLLRDVDLAQRLGRAGRKRVISDFNWDSLAKRLNSYL